MFDVCGDSRENLLEILAVVIILSPISSVGATFLNTPWTMGVSVLLMALSYTVPPPHTHTNDMSNYSATMGVSSAYKCCSLTPPPHTRTCTHTRTYISRRVQRNEVPPWVLAALMNGAVERAHTHTHTHTHIHTHTLPYTHTCRRMK